MRPTKKLTTSIISCIVACFFSAVCAAQKYEPTPRSSTEAIAKGEAKEFLSSMEVQALEAEKSANWSLAGRAYNEAARVAIRTGQLQKALSYANKSLEFADKVKDQAIAVRAIQFLSSVNFALRQYEKAREWIDRGIEVTKKLPLGPGKELYEGFFYKYLGQDYLRRGEFQKAIESLTYSLQVQDSRLNFLSRRGSSINPAAQNAAHTVVLSLNQLADAYIQAGDPENAIKVCQRGIDLIQHFRAKTPAETGLHQNLGQAYLAQKDFPRALEIFNKALSLAESQGRPAEMSAAYSRIADVHNQSGKPAEAVPYYQKAIEQIESIRSLLQSEQYRQSFFEGELNAYVSMIEVLLTSTKPEEAFNYSERACSRSFLDILGSKVQLARSGTLMEHERALQARISVLRGMAQGEEGEAGQEGELRKQLAEAEQAYNEYLTQLRKENKEQSSLMSIEPLTLKEVQERLGPGVTLLEYFVTTNNVYLWVVEKDRVEFVSSSISRKDLVTKVTELRDTIYQFGEKDRFNSLSQELHRFLIQPAMPHIRGKELIIVPHDVLHYLPFQTLMGSDNRYLIEKYPIYYLSSASLMQFTQEKRRAMGEKVLAFGNPDLDDPKMALQFAEIEAGEIKKLYPQANVLLKKEATEEKAKTLSPQNDIIHFASHAELNEDDPLASAILLAKSGKEDGRLEVREIFGMDLKASLVVLSACETGLGKLSSGDELVGLTRAFIYAGTPSVVASLWNVEDSSTAQLMASFYKNLKTMSKAEALRQAQLNLIRGNVNSDLLARRGIGGVGKLGEAAKSPPQPATPAVKSPVQDSAAMPMSTSHPYFWAPFILVGEGK